MYQAYATIALSLALLRTLGVGTYLLMINVKIYKGLPKTFVLMLFIFILYLSYVSNLFYPSLLNKNDFADVDLYENCIKVQEKSIYFSNV